MSDTQVRVRASAAKRAKAVPTERAADAETNAVLQAEFGAMMERSRQEFAKLTANMDELLISLLGSRLTSCSR